MWHDDSGIFFFWRAKWVSSPSFDLCQCKNSLKASKGRESIWRCRGSPLPLFEGSEMLRLSQRQESDRQGPEEAGTEASGNRGEERRLRGAARSSGRGGLPSFQQPPRHLCRGPACAVAPLPSSEGCRAILCRQLEPWGGRGYRWGLFFTSSKDRARKKKKKPALRALEKSL